MHNNTAIVYLTKDAKILVNANIKAERIIALSPDCYEILKSNYKNLLKPRTFLTPFKVTERLIYYEKKVRNILKDNHIISKEEVKETFIFQLINILSSVEWINLSIKNEETKYWTLVDNNRVVKIESQNEVLFIILKNIITNQIGQFSIKKKQKTKI